MGSDLISGAAGITNPSAGGGLENSPAFPAPISWEMERASRRDV